MRLVLTHGVFARAALAGAFCLVHAVWALSDEQTVTFLRQEATNGAVVLSDESGHRIRIRPYGNSMVRVQYARKGEDFFPDERYPSIERHDLGGTISVRDSPEALWITAGRVRLRATKRPLRLSFHDAAGQSLLAEREGPVWSAQALRLDYLVDPSEQFIGAGQKPLGYQDDTNLTGRRVRRNYGEDGVPGRGAQGNLLVPFFISSKGYGLFANCPFQNEMSLGADDEYSLRFETDSLPAQLDVVFILGPEPAEVLDRYTQLTGRPRLPPKWAFGLHLSDNDNPPKTDLGPPPFDEEWWRTMVARHRAAGFPLDHLVFDNDWRLGSGGWAGSSFEFDPRRYPNPAAFARWCRELGLTVTLDLNMNTANDSAGWQPGYNMPVVPGGADANADSYPDYSRREVRDWVWRLFWDKALDPKLGYPGDGLWMDETDGLWPDSVPDHLVIGNGRPWKEMKNLYYFFVAQAVVAEGWENTDGGDPAGIGEARRPFAWLRGGSAGGQRYASHWTGDIHFDQQSYDGQIVSMQASGLAGYPYFNHDAGGFVDNDDPGPKDAVYIQWGMALGSFTPIWRPHGYGLPRWPLNRSVACQDAFRRYARLRYELMPYIYTLAHRAQQTGLPMARPMAIAFPREATAWRRPLQYMWGDAMLVAPGRNLAGRDVVQSIWLPPAARWYSLWNDARYAGGQVIEHLSRFGELPVFVRSGAIVPRQKYALSTAWLSDGHLTLDVYAGADGRFVLEEDDGISERFRTRGERRSTEIAYSESGSDAKLTIGDARGSYAGATTSRSYLIRFHGVERPEHVVVNGTEVRVSPAEDEAPLPAAGAAWLGRTSVLAVSVEASPVEREVVVALPAR